MFVMDDGDGDDSALMLTYLRIMSVVIIMLIIIVIIIYGHQHGRSGGPKPRVLVFNEELQQIVWNSSKSSFFSLMSTGVDGVPIASITEVYKGLLLPAGASATDPSVIKGRDPARCLSIITD